MNRILPDQQFFHKGTLPTSAALITRNETYDAYVKQLILTNTSNADVTVTLTSAESSPTTEAVLVISAYDQFTHNYEEGWEFSRGIYASASASNSIRAQVWGFQKSTS